MNPKQDDYHNIITTSHENSRSYGNVAIEVSYYHNKKEYNLVESWHRHPKIAHNRKRRRPPSGWVGNLNDEYRK